VAASTPIAHPIPSRTTQNGLWIVGSCRATGNKSCVRSGKRWLEAFLLCLWTTSRLLTFFKTTSLVRHVPLSPTTAHLVVPPPQKKADVHYSLCKKIFEILEQTDEAKERNLFGQYSAKTLKDWQSIIKGYESNNVHLGEAAEMLISSVKYEMYACMPAACLQRGREGWGGERESSKGRGSGVAPSKGLHAALHCERGLSDCVIKWMRCHAGRPSTPSLPMSAAFATTQHAQQWASPCVCFVGTSRGCVAIPVADEWGGGSSQGGGREGRAP